jgi:hypothetical protein
MDLFGKAIDQEYRIAKIERSLMNLEKAPKQIPFPETETLNLNEKEETLIHLDWSRHAGSSTVRSGAR